MVKVVLQHRQSVPSAVAVFCLFYLYFDTFGFGIDNFCVGKQRNSEG
jgi:hypothetical protein